jgi:hypothetical protein
MSWWYFMKASFQPKAKWLKNAGGGSSVNHGFELGSAVFDEAALPPLMDCHKCWGCSHFFAAAIGS